MPILASWGTGPIILPFTTLKRTGHRLGFINSCGKEPFQTKLTSPPVFTNESASTSIFPHCTRTFKCKCRSSQCLVWTTLPACKSSTLQCINTSSVLSWMVSLLGWSCPSTGLCIVSPSFTSARPKPMFVSLARGFNRLGLAMLSIRGSSGALLGTMGTFLLSTLLICGGETSGIPTPWGPF